ncbi:MAG: hypothetical protein IKF91_03200 [Bacilli bacterium]|nr:hypothetical protein [Bacilli bacterium]
MDIDYYYFWDFSFDDFPIIPHIEKFIHNKGKQKLFSRSKEELLVLTRKFSNDK